MYRSWNVLSYEPVKLIEKDYPEVAEAYKRIAFEEAEHAAKFAELLGEVVEADTKANLDSKSKC